MGIKSNSRAAWYACHYCNLKITVLYLFLFWLIGGLLALRTLHLLVFIVKGFLLVGMFQKLFSFSLRNYNSLFSGWALLWLLRIFLLMLTYKIFQASSQYLTVSLWRATNSFGNSQCSLWVFMGSYWLITWLSVTIPYPRSFIWRQARSSWHFVFQLFDNFI